MELSEDCKNNVKFLSSLCRPKQKETHRAGDAIQPNDAAQPVGLQKLSDYPKAAKLAKFSI
jgi:hypothetical protein